MPEFLGRLIAKLAFRSFRWWLLHRSDQGIASRVRILRRLAYAFTGDEIILTAMNDIAEIFEGEARDTALVRRMFRESTPEYAEAVLRSLMRKD